MSRIGLPEGIALNDPRPIAAGAPYTFFMPHPEELAALRPGAGIQAIFREVAGGRNYEAERMWVLVQRIEDRDVVGTQDNEPVDMERPRGPSACPSPSILGALPSRRLRGRRTLPR